MYLIASSSKKTLLYTTLRNVLNVGIWRILSGGLREESVTHYHTKDINEPMVQEYAVMLYKYSTGMKISHNI